MEEGVCPNCGSEDLDYGSSEIQDESIIYPFTCKNCGKEGREWYRLVFDKIEVD